jgi:hypothetical protein
VENGRGLKPSRLQSSDVPVISGFLLLWVVLSLAINPHGNFPLVDDWSYGRTVKILVEQGRLFYDGWTPLSLFFQVLYGALFCLPFGFSFEALRIATLVAGFAGLVATYALLREAGANRTIAAMGTAVTVFNIQYFQHAFTFMTDVPSTALAVASAVFFCRDLRSKETRHVVIATILITCATLVRQTSMAVALAYALAGLLVQPRIALFRAIAPTAASAGVLWCYNTITDHFGITSMARGAVQAAVENRLQTLGLMAVAARGIELVFFQLAQAALFSSPFLLLLFADRIPWVRMPRQAAVISIAGAGGLFCRPRSPVRVNGALGAQLRADAHRDVRRGRVGGGGVANVVSADSLVCATRHDCVLIHVLGHGRRSFDPGERTRRNRLAVCHFRLFRIRHPDRALHLRRLFLRALSHPRDPFLPPGDTLADERGYDFVGRHHANSSN